LVFFSAGIGASYAVRTRAASERRNARRKTVPIAALSQPV